jgi:hypothetical protein
MRGAHPKPSVDVQALLEHERRLVALPAAARARAMVRARAALAIQAAPRPSAADTAISGPRSPRLSRWLAAACVAFLAGAASGVAAYEAGLRARAVPPPVIEPPPASLSTGVRAAARAATLEPLAPVPPPAVRGLSGADAVRAELRLLRQARAAVLREDYAAALPPLAEHARRFRHGRLAEEREALRVKALAGLGRDRDAARAAAAFEARFPRSPLVSAVNGFSTSGQ